MYIVYTASGSDTFATRNDALRWLALRGFVERTGQAGEYVCLDGTGNMFASLRRADHLDVEVRNTAMSRKAVDGV